jgi:hypothetical protein
MDNEDPLYSNRFIQDLRVSGGYGITQAAHNQQVREYTQRQRQILPEYNSAAKLVEDDPLKTNPVITPDGDSKPLGHHSVLKEQRTVLGINSDQRVFFNVTPLSDPTDFANYLPPNTYAQFSELYDLAASLSYNVLTYQEYQAQYGLEIIPVSEGELGCRQLVEGLVNQMAQQRYGLVEGPTTGVGGLTGLGQPLQVPAGTAVYPSFPATFAEINAGLINLLTSVAVNVSGRADLASTANVLNAFVSSAGIYNPSIFWRPFYYTGVTDGTTPGIMQITYQDGNPNNYQMTLPAIINNVKSVRVISSEVPNTVYNVTQRNNIVVLLLQYNALAGINGGNPVPVPLDPTQCIFNFILLQIPIGAYTLTQLLEALKDLLNDAMQNQVLLKQQIGTFDITLNPCSGEIDIVYTSPTQPVQGTSFHLKFYSELYNVVPVPNPTNPNASVGNTPGVVTEFGFDLWYKLGFPWPYQIASTGADLYTTLLTNVVNFGLHEVFVQGHPDNDIFNRAQVATDANYVALYNDQLYLTGGKYNIINYYRPYRYPNITVNYIYLVIKGFKALQHINQYNGVVSFTDNDILTKVQLNAPIGQTVFNGHIDNPKIFLNALPRVETLNISWVDETGALVEFGGVDQSFTLEIINYVTQVDVNAYNSALGTIDYRSYPLYLASDSTVYPSNITLGATAPTPGQVNEYAQAVRQEAAQGRVATELAKK